MAALITFSTNRFSKWSYIVVLLILFLLLHSVSSYEFSERTQVLPRLLHTFFRSDEFFIMGMLAGYTYNMYGDALKRYTKILTLCSIIFYVGFIISFPFVLEQILGILPNHYLDFRVYEYALPLSVLMSGLLLCIALTDSALAPVLHNKTLLLIGKISFGIYLVHDFFLRIFIQAHVFPVSIGICIAMALCLTLAVSYALHILVEKPSISYARKIE